MGIGLWKFLHNGIAHGLLMSHPFNDPSWAVRFHKWTSDKWMAAEKAATPAPVEVSTAHSEALNTTLNLIAEVKAPVLPPARDYFVPANRPKRVSKFPSFYIRRIPTDRTPSAQQKLRKEQQFEIDLEFNRRFLQRAFGATLAPYTSYGVDEDGDLYFSFVTTADAERLAKWFNNLAGADEDEYSGARSHDKTVWLSCMALDDLLEIETPEGYKMDSIT